MNHSADPQATYELLRREAASYSAALAAKPHVVVLTKADLLTGHTPPPNLRVDVPVHVISAATGAGVPALKEALWRKLSDSRATK